MTEFVNPPVSSFIVVKNWKLELQELVNKWQEYNKKLTNRHPWLNIFCSMPSRVFHEHLNPQMNHFPLTSLW